MLNKTTRFLTAIGLIIGASAANIDDAQAQKMEKCYGIVKAGKNDCVAADGRHTCAGYAKESASMNEWVLLPHGACDRIVGASPFSEVDSDKETH